jgi:hypothetical protein
MPRQNAMSGSISLSRQLTMPPSPPQQQRASGSPPTLPLQRQYGAPWGNVTNKSRWDNEQEFIKLYGTQRDAKTMVGIIDRLVGSPDSTYQIKDIIPSIVRMAEAEYDNKNYGGSKKMKKSSKRKSSKQKLSKRKSTKRT